MAKITKRTVDGLQPGAKPYVAFDGDVKGFGLRIMPSGVKSYILEYRPGAGGRGIAKKRLTIGRHGAMTAEQARRAALEALARIRLGGMIRKPRRAASGLLLRSLASLTRLLRSTSARSASSGRRMATRLRWDGYGTHMAPSRLMRSHARTLPLCIPA
jgi:hypothetical protein